MNDGFLNGTCPDRESQLHISRDGVAELAADVELEESSLLTLPKPLTFSFLPFVMWSGSRNTVSSGNVRQAPPSQSWLRPRRLGHQPTRPGDGALNVHCTNWVDQRLTYIRIDGDASVSTAARQRDQSKTKYGHRHSKKIQWRGFIQLKWVPTVRWVFPNGRVGFYGTNELRKNRNECVESRLAHSG